MKKEAIVELGLILLVCSGVLLAPDLLPDQLNPGALILISSGLLLLQSLVRDLWLLSMVRGKDKPNTARVSRSICVESVLGGLGVGIGLVGIAVNARIIVDMTGVCWALVVLVVTGGGFLVKDYVLDLKPLRLRKDTNHMNIIVKWRQE